MDDFNWHCPHCDRAVTISEGKQSSNSHLLLKDSADGQMSLASQFIICPNNECKKVTLLATLCNVTWNGEKYQRTNDLKSWRLLPTGSAKAFPDYVPAVIKNDYEEACEILNLSPKASATLSRRALQGILRDYWKVKPGKLVAEIEQIKDKTDGTTWNAIDAVRKIGNIGAHMENDINVIVDVDPNEAGLLISLVETLLTEWYVGTHERERRMQAVVTAAEGKKPPKGD